MYANNIMINKLFSSSANLMVVIKSVAFWNLNTVGRLTTPAL